MVKMNITQKSPPSIKHIETKLEKPEETSSKFKNHRDDELLSENEKNYPKNIQRKRSLNNRWCVINN